MDWSKRYLQQARWTAQLRHYLFNKAGLSVAGRCLDVGCGTGAVMQDIPDGCMRHGVDIHFPSLSHAVQAVPGAHLVAADGIHLPYDNQVFDITYCHFVFLWVRDPLQVLLEMSRVTRVGGAVLALAEPDYGGRIDYPEELAQVGLWQTQSLRGQGADPQMGRKLAALFNQVGLRQVEAGVLGGEWRKGVQNDDFDLEWQVLEEDFGGRISHSELGAMSRLDAGARSRGERILYVPTFYAWGVV